MPLRRSSCSRRREALKRTTRLTPERENADGFQRQGRKAVSLFATPLSSTTEVGSAGPADLQPQKTGSAGGPFAHENARRSGAGPDRGRGAGEGENASLRGSISPANIASNGQGTAHTDGLLGAAGAQQCGPSGRRGLPKSEGPREERLASGSRRRSLSHEGGTAGEKAPPRREGSAVEGVRSRRNQGGERPRQGQEERRGSEGPRQDRQGGQVTPVKGEEEVAGVQKWFQGLELSREEPLRFWTKCGSCCLSWRHNWVNWPRTWKQEECHPIEVSHEVVAYFGQHGVARSIGKGQIAEQAFESGAQKACSVSFGTGWVPVSTVDHQSVEFQ